MHIREMVQSDRSDLFSWRNDELSRQMSFNSSLVTKEEHNSWFKVALNNDNKLVYVGLDNEHNKIGVCRFDIEDDFSNAEVSINVNPLFRGRGLSRELLELSISRFKEQHNCNLFAKIKCNNVSSIKIFERCYFYFTKKSDDFIFLTNSPPILDDPLTGLNLEKITGLSNQISSLFELLKKRKFSISHQVIPSFKEHELFVQNHPYRVWYIISLNSKHVGSIYLQNDNSVGVNLQEPSLKKMLFCLNFIKTNFYPFPEKKSLIPPYFYLNIPSTDEELNLILEEMRLAQIQTSFKF